MTNKPQKPRKFWMNDEEYRMLCQKAQEHFEGKGFLSHYLKKIALAQGIIILEGKSKVPIKIEVKGGYKK